VPERGVAFLNSQFIKTAGLVKSRRKLRLRIRRTQMFSPSNQPCATPKLQTFLESEILMRISGYSFYWRLALVS
jgi:hypothetical protein